MSPSIPDPSTQSGTRPTRETRLNEHTSEVTTRLIIELNGPQTTALDRIAGVDRDCIDDSQRREAVARVLLEYDEQLQTRRRQSEQAARGLRKLRDELDAARTQRRRAEDALEAERKTRLQIAQRLTSVRRRFHDALGSARRLRASRDRYRDLAVRVEAAMLHSAPRHDFAGLEARLTRALRAAGFVLPGTAREDAEPRP